MLNVRWRLQLAKSRPFSRTLFPGWLWKEDASIKVLGAPIGKASYCEEIASKRVGKAKKLLEDLVDFEDAQGALQLVRNCGSWCKVLYACRTVPPALQKHALNDFMQHLRRAIEAIAGDPMQDSRWCMAQLGSLMEAWA